MKHYDDWIQDIALEVASEYAISMNSARRIVELIAEEETEERAIYRRVEELLHGKS
jgi:hypothetical protein